MPLMKTISFPPEDHDLYEWLSKQANQSGTIREALRLLRDKLEGKMPDIDLSALRADLDEIKRAIAALGVMGVDVSSEVEEDQDAVSLLLDNFGDKRRGGEK